MTTSATPTRRTTRNSLKASPYAHEHAAFDVNHEEEDNAKRRRSGDSAHSVLSGLLALVAFVAINAVLVYGVHVWCDGMPTPVPADAAQSVFSEARAKAHLENLARVARMSWPGTKANDAAANYIAEQMQQLSVVARSVEQVRFELDVQQVSGVTEFDILGGHMTNVFNNLTNVIVRLRFGHALENPPALLINSHFDTPLASDGAVDARAPIATMIETVRALLHTPRDQLDLMARQNVAVIYLFNGGEEVLQMASTGFITQHRWASTVRTVLNCDAVGVRGGAVLFQNGGMPYLTAYARSVPRPYGTSVAADIFSSGLVQSDTDYRIFVKYANVTGLDWAIYRESHAYHTDRDTVARLQPGLLQHEGDNMLSYARDVLSGSLLHEDLTGKQADGVYFDLVQTRFVLYSKTTAAFINVIVGLALFALVRRELHSLGESVLPAARNALLLCVGGYASVGVTGVVLNFVAPFLWYARMYLLVPLFVLPLMLFVIVFIQRRAHRAPRELERLVFLEVQLVHVWSMLSMTVVNMGSAYLLLVLCIGHVVSHGIMTLSPRKQYLSPLIYVLYAVICAVVIVPTMTGVMELFVPLMGRLGSVPADILVAVLMGWMSHVIVFMVPAAVARIGDARRAALTAFAALFVIVLVLSIALYRNEPFTPDRPKRVYMQHAVRAQPFVDGPSSLNEGPHFFIALCDNGPYLPMLRDVINDAQALPTTSKLRRLAPNSTLFTSTTPSEVFKKWSHPLDFDAVYPYNYFLSGFVLDATPIVLRAPELTVVSTAYDAALNQRRIVVRADYHVHEAMTFRFRGDNVIRWAAWDRLPSMTRGWYVGRHVAGRQGSKVLEIDLTLRGNVSVPFQFAGMRFDISDDYAELIELFPKYVTVVAFATATSSYLI